MESQIKNAESKEWQLGLLRNIEQFMPHADRKSICNCSIVKGYLLRHTHHGGLTCAVNHCRWLGIDPDGYTFIP